MSHRKSFPSSMDPTRFLGLALGALSLAALARAQDVTPIVLTGGSVGTLPGPVLDILGVEVDSQGEWLVRYRVASVVPTLHGDVVVGSSLGTVWRERDPIPLLGGVRIGQIGGITATESPGTLGTLQLQGGQRGLFLDQVPLIMAGDPVVAVGASPGSVWTAFHEPKSAFRAYDQFVLVRGIIDDPSVPGPNDDVLVRARLAPFGLSGPAVIAYKGLSISPLPGPVEAIASTPNGVALAANGHVLWVADLATGSSTDDDIVMFDWFELMREGQPVFGTAQRWGALADAAVSLNAAGEWAVRAKLDAPWPVDEIIARNTGPFVVEGGSLPAISPYAFRATNAAAAFGTGAVELDEEGHLLWFGRWDDPNVSDASALFLDDRILVQAGVTQVQGRTLLSIGDGPGDYALSPGGGFAVFRGVLGGPGQPQEGAFLVRLQIGRSYCPAMSSSTGLAAQLYGFGSPFVAQNALRLEASVLPPNALSLLLVGSTAAFIHFPGGSQGTLCLGGQIGRFMALAGSSGPAGHYARAIDLSVLPLAGGTGAAIPGTTLRFQCWFRDANPAPTSNFTEALELLVR